MAEPSLNLSSANATLEGLVELANSNRADFGNMFTLVRRRRMWTQARLADAFRMAGYPYDSQPKVSNFEQGHIGHWTVEIMCLVLGILHMTPQQFVDEMGCCQTFLISKVILFIPQQAA